MPIAHERVLAQRFSNLVQSGILLLALGALLAFLGYTIAGRIGAFIAATLAVATLLASSQLSPLLILRLYRARPLSPRDQPLLYQILAALAQRGGLGFVPRIYYIPSPIHNAFAVGSGEAAVIGLTDGLLRAFTPREVAGILAHEVSHIRNRDTLVMAFADITSRLTASFANLGLLLLVLNLPLLAMGGGHVPWLLILALVLSPTLSSLLQLGLSRTREYRADLEAVRLTEDPRGLASALAKLEALRGGFFERILLPGRQVPEPSLLRTHPPTEERVRRLLELEHEQPVELLPGWEGFEDAGGGGIAGLPGEPLRRPRWRVSGIWY